MCLDHPEVQALVSTIEDRRVITYGEKPQADVRFHSAVVEGAGTNFAVTIRERKTGKMTEIRAAATHAGASQCVQRDGGNCGCA